MLWLSDEALEYAIARCRNKQRYYVGVAPQNRNKKESVENYLLSRLSGTSDFRICKYGNNFMIIFKNGSYIKIIPAEESSRGNKLHLLIADEEISDDILSCVLRPCEVIERMERQERRRQRNTDRFKSEYLSQPMKPTGLWERERSNLNADKEVADVSEEEFMNILNVSTKEKKEYE